MAEDQKDLDKQKESFDKMRENQSKLRVIVDAIGERFSPEKLRSISSNVEKLEFMRSAKGASDLAVYFAQLNESLAQDIEGVAVESTLAAVESFSTTLDQIIQDQAADLWKTRRMATLGVMASGLAHEINQPLQVILSVAQNCATEIQRDIIDNEGILVDLDKITANTERINKIVNHLLVLSRDHKPKTEEVDVNTVIENSFIMFYQQLTKSRGIKIIKNLSAGLPSIKADSIQLEQVFINLINNARDALDGCKDRTIEVSTKKEDGHILVEFRDSGKGIAPEDLPKIFDAFFTTKEEGMGLGLHISQDIVQSYGGTITAHSEVDEGTTFLIELPVAEEEAK